jgi:hypothetical protein
VVGDDSGGQSVGELKRQPVGLPRFGTVASGALSLFFVSSLLFLFPLGLIVAPLGLIPVVQQVAVGRRSVESWGWVLALLAALTVGGVTILGLHFGVFLLAYSLVVVIPVVSVELWQRIRCPEGRWVAGTTLAGCVLCLATVVSLAWPEPPLGALTEWWQQAAATAEQAYQEVGVSSGQLELALDAVETIIPWTAPSLPVAYLVAILVWIRPRLPVLGFPLPIEPFENFRSEEWLPAVFAVSGIGTLLLRGTLRWVAASLLIAVLMLYFVQGLAIIRAHLARWIGRGWLVRWGVVLVCLQGPMPLLVAALGMVDGFHSLRPRSSDDGGEQ